MSNVLLPGAVIFYNPLPGRRNAWSAVPHSPLGHSFGEFCLQRQKVPPICLHFEKEHSWKGRYIGFPIHFLSWCFGAKTPWDMTCLKLLFMIVYACVWLRKRTWSVTTIFAPTLVPWSNGFIVHRSCMAVLYHPQSSVTGFTMFYRFWPLLKMYLMSVCFGIPSLPQKLHMFERHGHFRSVNSWHGAIIHQAPWKLHHLLLPPQV